HGFDHFAVPVWWILRLQDRLPARSGLPDWFRQAVSAHDHDRRIYPAFSEHCAGHGLDLRNANPGVFSLVHGHPQPRLHVETLPLCDSDHLYHCGHRDAHAGHRKHVHFRGTHGRPLRGQRRDRVAGASQTAAGAEGEAGAIMRWTSVRGILLLSCTLGGFAYDHMKDAAQSQSAPQAASETPAPALNLPPDNSPPPSIDANRAFQYVKEVVKFGERPIGSANHKKLEDYILEHLKGDQVESDTFTADTVEGKFPVHNIIAKYPSAKDGIIVIAGHYDTNYPLRGTGYVGANDGGSTTAILLEFANQLRGKKRDGYSVWLLWTDAEEAVRTWSDTDSLYGTRHLAARWQQDGTAKKIKAFLLTDMIGDADLDIDRDDNSTPWL